MKIAFVHIPKTAGTSFRVCLERAFGRDHVYLAYPGHELNGHSIVEWNQIDPQQRDHYRVLLGHYHFPVLKAATTPEDFKFVTFLRDPIARNISLYAHILRHDKRFKNDPPSIADLIESGPADVRIQFDNHQTRIISGLGAVKGVTNECLASAIAYLKNEFYLVGTTETFKDDTDRFFKKLGLPDVLPEQTNVSSKKIKYDNLSIRDRIALENSSLYDKVLYKTAQQWLRTL